MKSNNTPVKIRIARRIENLEFKLEELRPVPYGRPNPYYKCGSCGRSMIEASWAGHFKGCKFVGIENEIAYYKKLL